MVVKPRLARGRREIKVAFDGEAARMRAPIHIGVLDKPLYLLQALAGRNGAPSRAHEGGGMSILLHIADTHFGSRTATRWSRP